MSPQQQIVQEVSTQTSDPCDLFIDSFTSNMFEPRHSAEYQVSLLKKRIPQEIQWQVDATGAFWAQSPVGLASDQHYWVIDHAVRKTGLVIPQKIWAPKKTSDKVRRVDHEQLHPPIFFIHKNGQDLGLRLTDAAGGNCMCLQGAEEAAPVGPSSHAQIRINWCGYQHLDWNEQISIKKQTQEKETILLETFAKHVARKVSKFMEFARTENYEGDHLGDQKYRIGDDRITPSNIILIGTVQVSQGSWMPILQVNNGYELYL